MRYLIFRLFSLALFGASFVCAQELTVEVIRSKTQDNSGQLLLSEFTAISADSAKELAKIKGWVSLNGLTSLSNEAADALGQHNGPLHLNGLTKISDEAAKALARHNGELSLNGLTAISEQAAVVLAQHGGGKLYLKGLMTLSPEAGKALAQRKGRGGFSQIHLDGLTTLSVEAAAALAGTNGHQWYGSLPNLKTISPEVAVALAKRGDLNLPGLTSLSEESAKALLGKHNGNLPGLTSLTVETAKAIAKGRPRLTFNLDGLTALPDDVALAFTTGKDVPFGRLHLNGLNSLTPIAAKAISSGRQNELYLNGLKAVSDETLKALAQDGPKIAVVYLKGLTSLSDEGAALLAAWPRWCGELPALPTVSEMSATALAASRNWNGKLPAMATLSTEVARALAQRDGNLSLNGLTTVSDEAAKALALHKGGTLSLDGITSISDVAALALAQREGRLSLNGLTSLSNSAAKGLATHKGDWLFLDGLTTLTDEAAASLASHLGAISLNGLATLSPQAAKSLGSIALPGKFRRVALSRESQNLTTSTTEAAGTKFVGSFLEKNCASCHDADTKEGEFTLDKLEIDTTGSRVAYASILERLRAGDMPPPNKKTRPDPAETVSVLAWIQTRLNAPLTGKPAYFAVKEKPIDGNRLPHAILFGGPRGPSVPPPPRLWRISPSAFNSWAGGFGAHGLQQPFGLIVDAGFKDFSALYTPDEGATSLLVMNAEQIVAAQAGNFKAIMDPKVKASREQLVNAIQRQFMTAVSRPPSQKELESLLALYEEVAREGDYALASKTVLMAPLLIPEAILRFEVGLGSEVRPGVRMLSPRETALALSLALSTKRIPSLQAAADGGKLTTRDEVAKSVRAILDDPKGSKPRVLGFFREYFNYHAAPEVFKDPLPDYEHKRGVFYSPGEKVQDTDVLVLSILSRDKDVLKELLTTPESFRTHELFFGNMDGLNSGEAVFQAFGPVALEHRRPPQDDRIGVLMQPSWQIAWSTNFHNDIVRRGRWVREHLLGGRVPDLPINAAAMIPDDPHHTLRQRQMVTREAACWKCHYRMDELGLPFENVNHYGFPIVVETVLDLDATAKLKNQQKVYRGAPLDTTGFIRHSGDPVLDGPVKDAPQMLRRMAESDRVRQVFIRHVFRYFMGRNETPGDAVSLQEAEKAYLDSGGSFKALLVSLLSSESFLYRTDPDTDKK